MPQNPVRRLLKAFLVAGPEQRMQQNVIRLERSVGFEFAAPVSFFMLLREQKFPRSRNRRAYTAGKFLNFSEAKLWVRTERCRGYMGIGGVCYPFNSPLYT